MRTQANINNGMNGTALKSATIRKSGMGLAALAAAGIAATLSGCGRAPAPKTHLYVGLDMSGSVIRRQGAFALLTEDLARPLVPGQDWLSLYRVCRRTETFYDQPVEGGTDGLEDVIVAEAQKSRRQGGQPPGTFPAAFWTEVARRAAEDPSRSEIVLFSDGDNDDMTSAAREALGAAARALAANPHVVGVAFYAVNPDNMAALRRTFGGLGDRLHLYGPQEDDVRPFTDTLVPNR